MYIYINFNTSVYRALTVFSYCLADYVLDGSPKSQRRRFTHYRTRLVPHVDKAPLPLRILRLVTSNFLPVENPTHPTAHAPERASVYILGQFRTSK